MVSQNAQEKTDAPLTTSEAAWHSYCRFPQTVSHHCPPHSLHSRHTGLPPLFQVFLPRGLGTRCPPTSREALSPALSKTGSLGPFHPRLRRPLQRTGDHLRKEALCTPVSCPHVLHRTCHRLKLIYSYRTLPRSCVPEERQPHERRKPVGPFAADLLL